MKDHVSKGKEHASEGRDPPKRFFKFMKGNAKEIEENCKLFLAVARFIKTQLDSIPTDNSDKNHVDRWLELQQEEQ